MRLSVVVAAYNEVDYIDQCLESVFMQKGIDDFEVIIGDDGSNDGTQAKIELWRAKYPAKIKVFVMERPESMKDVIASVRVSEIIKRGIATASGKYICFLAGDDFYCDDLFFQKQIDNLQQPAHQNCVASICCYEKYWDDDERKKQNDYFIKTDTLSSKVYLGGHMYMHLSAFVFRNILLNCKQNIEALHFIDDVGLTFIFGNEGDFCGIEDVMFCYRQRPKSIMANNDPNDNRLSSLLLYTELLEQGFWKYPVAYRARMLGAMARLFDNRKQLVDMKYDKYFKLGSKNKKFNENVYRGEVAFSRRILFLIKRIFYYGCYVPYRLIIKVKYH